MHVQTDHQIVAHGDHVMKLYDGQGNILASAERSGESWKVTSDDGETTADTRSEAVGHMTEHALKVSDGDGFSTLVPHGLLEQF